MSDWDTSSPADNDVISQFPANERAQRGTVKGIFEVDHHGDNDADQGRHEQVTLMDLPEPATVVGRGVLYYLNGDLFLKNGDGNNIQLTFGDLPGGDSAVPLPRQTVSPAPIDGGWLYTLPFDGGDELYFQDSDGNIIRMTYKGQLVVNLQDTDVVVGSIRTRHFIRGNVVDVAIVEGVATIDWQAGTVFRLTVTENIDVVFENMPQTDDNEEQCIYIDLINGGNYAINVTSSYTVQWPGQAVPALTENGRDYILAACNNGTTITAVALLDIGAPV